MFQLAPPKGEIGEVHVGQFNIFKDKIFKFKIFLSMIALMSLTKTLDKLKVNITNN